MNENLNLSDEQLRAFTGKKHRDKQIMVLRFMGINYRKRPDGSLAVLCKDIDMSIGT
jgi:hypothetical protein